MTTFNKYIRILLWTAIILLVAGIFLGWLANLTISDQKKIAGVTQRLEDEVHNFEGQINKLRTQIDTHSITDLFTEIKEKFSYALYLFEGGKIAYWSDNSFVPQYQDLLETKSMDFVELRQGQFIVIKVALSGADRQLVGLIPIFYNSQIDNQHLQSSVNTKVFANSAIHLSKYESELAKSPVCIKGQCLFYVGFTDNYVVRNDIFGTISFLLICAGILCFVVLMVNFLFRDKFSLKGILLFLSFLVGLRLLMLSIKFPQQLITIKVFDPKLFASSMLNASLGDMFLNLLFLLIFVIALIGLFRTDRLSTVTIGQRWKALWTILLAICSQFALFSQFLILETLYSNSRYSLDITQSINFFYDRVIVYIIFLLGTILFFFFSHFCYLLLVRLHQHTVKTMWVLYGTGTLFFSIGLIVLGYPLLTVLLSLIYFVVIYAFGLLNRLDKINYFLFTYIFCATLICTVLCTYAVVYFENQRVEKNKEKFALHFLIGNDVLAEFLLAEAMENINSDAFIKSQMFSPFIANKNSIREKIKKVYLNKYFDKYELEIKLYNNAEQVYGSNIEDNYSKFKKSFGEQFKTSYKNLYYVNKLDVDVTKRYVGFVEIRNDGWVTGYLVMDLKLKKIIPNNVYPELLVDSRFLLPFENKNYSYAIYNEGKLLSYSGDFDYQNDFDISYLSKEKITKKGFDHLIMEDDEGRKVIISSKEYSWFYIASNFSFLVLTLMFLIVLLLIVYTIYFHLSNRSLNYYAKIQLYFNLAFLLPLFSISVTMISLVNASHKEEVAHEHFKKALLIGHYLEEPLEKFSVDGDRSELENSLVSIAEFSNSDANLFDIDGKLIATSQPLIYKKEVLSPYLATYAMNTIVKQRKHELTVTEQIGKLKYNTTYVAIQENDIRNLVAVLSVPYFGSEFKLEKDKVEIFTTILNIFTLVFMVFLVLSYIASKRLTFPLVLITQKLKKTTLSGKNEPLLWDSSDEIGLMVSEYNKMVVNLEDSKKVLARTQKGTAWREIAQQVAHEIKNPITPMKLTLQHLKRTLSKEPDDRLQRPVNTLLNQVDTLSEIVTSFSSFAKMPIPEQEKYELTHLIRETVALYEKNITGEMVLELNHKEIYTVGDKQLMGRILSNIIINAKQAAAAVPIKILVKLEVMSNKKLLITIADNGLGIPKDIRKKVFTPKFTTKTSGSGIGLAIAKHGIEYSGGQIWFETVVGKGTTFFMELIKVSK